jgi:hypothetical protein
MGQHVTASNMKLGDGSMAHGRGRVSYRMIGAGITLRHRTAISRGALSRPLRLAVESGLIHPQSTVFDYGCGRGDDVQALRAHGIQSQG